MGRRSEKIFFHRGNLDGQQAHEKMLNINNDQRNAHQLKITMTYPGAGDGLGSLVCCSPWGCKELDMTELK